MNHELHHLAAAYSLDALSPDERRAFEAHYPSCEICTGEIGDYRATAAHLATAAAEAPPADLRARVLAEIGHTRQVSALAQPDAQPSRWNRIPRWGYAVAAAAALLLVIGTVIAMVGDGDGTNFEDEFASILAQPDAQFRALSGEGRGSVSVVWSADLGRVGVVGDGLAPVDPSSTYELWLLDDTGAAPAGLFVPDDDGLVRTIVDLDGSPTAWGVTIEPESGSPQPTGDILYLGEV